jgi:hypothetical protein
VELLAMLVVTGLGVRVVVDDLDCPLRVLELHLLLVVALMGNMPLAFPLAERRAVMVGLLLILLVELFHKLLDLPALLSAVAPGVVDRAPRSALVAARGLAWSLVTAWATAPISRCCDSGGSGSACQQFVVVGLLLPILVLATALSSGIFFRLANLPCHQSRLGVPCTPFYSPGTFVCQVEELRDIFHLVGGHNFSSIFSSLTPSQKAATTKALEMRGIVFQTWENRWMRDRSDFPGHCCTAWRSTSLPGQA